jgi:hypothetical protein
MREPFQSTIEKAKRHADLTRPKETPPEGIIETEKDTPQQDHPAFSLISADRHQKTMLEFRLLDGNAFALAYAYLVGIQFNPSMEIQMDFSGYQVHLTGRNLRPLFDALVAQRVASIHQMDDLQARANLPETATVVLQIEVKS